MQRRGAELARAAALALALLQGCLFSPSIEPEDCALKCSNDECPAGYGCREVQEGVGYCVALSSHRQCRAAEPSSEQPPEAATEPGSAERTGARESPDVLGSVPCARSGTLPIEPCPPVPPCRGAPFSIQLNVAGGRAPYTWRAEPAPGLELDPNTGRVLGTVHAELDWTVHVTDAAGAEGEARYELTPRDDCWFGFVDAALGARRLHLVDPLAEADGEALLLLPETLDDAESVRDFRFSSDGRWLAVRVEARGRRRLSLYEAPLWTAIGSTDASVSVDEYAWAPDGAVLAVAGERDDAAIVCALRVLGPDAATGGSRLLMQAESPAPPGSALLWFGDQAIAFHSGEGQFQQNRLVYGGQLGGSGFMLSAFFGASYTHSPDAPLSLVRSRNGFLALAPSGKDITIDHYRMVDGMLARTPHRPNLELSPDADYLAHADQGRLLIYAADETRIDPLMGYPVASLEGDDCEALLAWSHESDWVACATNGLPDPGLRLFRLNTTLPRAQPGPPGASVDAPWRTLGLTAFDVEGSELYSAALSQRRRRGFSPGGRWFLFATDHALYAVDLHEPRLQIRQSPARFESLLVSSDFIPSPDGQWLITHQGAWLSRHAIAALSQASALTDAELDPALPCSESRAVTRGDGCGSGSTRSARVAWSPGSRAVAFRSKDSELRVLRLSPNERERRLSVACDVDCFQTSAFQPAAPMAP